MLSFDEGITIIREALKVPLPGEHAQYAMAPLQRKTREEYLRKHEAYKQSSVMILLYPDEAMNMSTVLIERPGNSGVHSGQIAFPGGKQDPGDVSHAHTALRETEEEIGVKAGDISILGELSPLFIPASNFLVHPFIGSVQSQPEFRPSIAEVKKLLTSTVLQLLDMPVYEKPFHTSYGNLTAPYYDFMGYAVWGATAMIISEFRLMIEKYHRTKGM